MDITISPRTLKGVWKAPLSKAVCHRLIICNAIRKLPINDEWLFCDDTLATYKGIRAIFSGKAIAVDCGDSASTYRFLKPVAEAAGSAAEFVLSERLRERIKLSGDNPALTSQGISGMLMANLLKPGYFKAIPKPRVSAGYVEMTKAAIEGKLSPEGDWSIGANFVLANHLGAEIEIQGLPEKSIQPDACIEEKLRASGDTLDISGCPDIAPVLYAASELTGKKTNFSGLNRLKYKESDRMAATALLLKDLSSGIIQTFQDHRIAMLAGILACMGYGNGAVTITGAECVEKSYPDFWKELKRLSI